MVATEAGSTHPTGMHSCYILCIYWSQKTNKRLAVYFWGIDDASVLAVVVMEALNLGSGIFYWAFIYFAGNQNAGDSDDTVLYLYRVSDDPQALFTVRWKICKF